MPLSEARIFRTRGDKDDRPLVKSLLKKLGEYMDAEALSKVEEAFEFGAGAHKARSGRPGRRISPIPSPWRRFSAECAWTAAPSSPRSCTTW